MDGEMQVGVDESLADVIGCDPGPVHCAFARVRRGADGALRLVALAYPRWDELLGDPRGGPLREVVAGGRFAFAYEKVTCRYGASVGATTYDTCRNSGVAVAAMARAGAESAMALGTVDWRCALGGRANLTDAEVRAGLLAALGPESDAAFRRAARAAKEAYSLPKPVGGHLRDAAGVAAGAFLMARRGVPARAREVWHG